MKTFIIGLIVGISLTGIAWAASMNIILQSANGIAISISNPLPVIAN